MGNILGMNNNNNINQHNKNPLIIHIPSYPTIGGEEPNLVIPGLYISSAGTARDKQKLEEFNITHILTAASAIFPKYVGEYNYMILEVQDWAGEDILYYFDEAIKFIDEARQNGGNVLVHCMAGISRSATIVIAYVMHSEKVTFSVAFEKLKKARPIIRPNGAFTRQLEIFERWIIGASPSLSFASEVLSEPSAEISEDKNKEEEMWELAMCKLLFRLEFLSGLGKRRRKITGEDPEVILHKRVYSKVSSTSNRLAPLYYFTDPTDPRNAKEKEEEDEDDDDNATRITPALMAALSVALDKQTKSEIENEEEQEEEIEETQNLKREYQKHTVWVWACVQCGRYLFTPLNITSISLPLPLSAIPSSSCSSSSSSSPPSPSPPPPLPSSSPFPSLLSSPNMYYEIEGMEWMKELDSSSHDIKCPNCFKKIGEYYEREEREKSNFGTIEDRPVCYVYKKDVEKRFVTVEV